MVYIIIARDALGAYTHQCSSFEELLKDLDEIHKHGDTILSVTLTKEDL